MKRPPQAFPHRTLSISWLVVLHALISFSNRAHRPIYYHFFHKYRAAAILLCPYSRWFCIRTPHVVEAAPSTGAQAFPPPCWLLCECRTVLQWWAFPWFKNIIIENFHVITVIFIQLPPVIPHVVPLVVSHAVISCPNRAHRTLSISCLVVLHALISFPNRAHRPIHYHFFHKYRPATILFCPYSRWFCIRSPTVGESAPSTGVQAFPPPCWLLCECRTVLQWWALRESSEIRYVRVAVLFANMQMHTFNYISLRTHETAITLLLMYG